MIFRKICIDRHSLGVCICKEVLHIILLSSITVFIYTYYADFHIMHPKGIKWGAIIFSLLPVYWLYCLLHFLFQATTSLCISLFVTSTCIAIHRHKFALTGAPLSWTDMSDRNTILMSISFIPTWLFVVSVIVIVLACIASWRPIRDRIKTLAFSSYILHTVAILLLSLLAYQPYHGAISSQLAEQSTHMLERLGILYFSWDWSENIRMNGLPMHLVQTSVRSIPKQATSQEQQALDNLAPTMTPKQGPKHIFFILCEACWYDAHHFNDAVAPLAAQGLSATRGISPAYGGGTANAAFEMLTSLPARGALQGIIYQEYAALMAAKTTTIPSQLKQQGYQTIALHNFHRTFWQRHIVMQKLGFDHFYAIEDMHYVGPMHFPRDTVLYDAALSLLKTHQDQPLFFNLETVYTHADYKSHQDHGQSDYAQRLTTSMRDMAAFIAAVKIISPEALFVVYGDHKPILTKYFYDEGILPDNLFLTTGQHNGDFSFKQHANQAVLGDVPVWIGTGDPSLTAVISTATDGQAFYCISSLIDHHLLATQNPASRYAQQFVCRDDVHLTYQERAKKMPSWLYAHTLFQQ